ncbi:putative orfan [Tupanvirus soda lake]|uniref:Orfan n=2 Tax=Tupanvirus TaxID=2094720 RepID=A0AC62AAU6_9VIRU|nr:putative orfan [Tupanvirus soda lake]QKU34803.1 putative orfan [Tupanvirus soda lake]
MPRHGEEDSYDKKHYDYCGYVAPKKHSCFDEKISKSKWNCDDKKNKKHYNKKHDDKKEEEYKPFDRCKCRDFKVVYYLPKFYVDELRKQEEEENKKNKKHRKDEKENDDKDDKYNEWQKNKNNKYDDIAKKPKEYKKNYEYVYNKKHDDYHGKQYKKDTGCGCY